MVRPRKFHSFPEFRDHILATYLGYYPTLASTLGLHEYDGVVEDFSTPRREQYLNEIQCGLDTLLQQYWGPRAIHRSTDELVRFECKAIEWKLRDEIFRLTEFRDFEWNPMVYNDQLEIR